MYCHGKGTWVARVLLRTCVLITDISYHQGMFHFISHTVIYVTHVVNMMSIMLYWLVSRLGICRCRLSICRQIIFVDLSTKFGPTKSTNLNRIFLEFLGNFLSFGKFLSFLSGFPWVMTLISGNILPFQVLCMWFNYCIIKTRKPSSE